MLDSLYFCLFPLCFGEIKSFYLSILLHYFLLYFLLSFSKDNIFFFLFSGLGYKKESTGDMEPNKLLKT